jgi:death-on-curing protein
VKYLTEDQILFLHSAILQETGGTEGVRDENILLSALGQPKQIVFGKELYPSDFLKAASYMRILITHHPFIDGNKRTGMMTGFNFLVRNGYRITASDDEVFEFAIRIAEEKLEPEEIAGWLETHSVRK